MFIYGVISWGIEFQAICIILYIILCKIVAPSHDSRLGLFNRARVKNLLDWLFRWRRSGVRKQFNFS